VLNIFFGDMPGAIYDTASYFNNTYLDSWLEEDLSQKILKSVDKAKVLGPQAVESQALGVIPATSISGGAKTLLLVEHMPQKVFNVSTCGDNCSKWLLTIAKRHKEDITVNLHHLMNFDPEGSGKRFEIRIVNTGDIVHDMKEYVVVAGTLLGGENIS
jgi:hypothetical protein